MEDAVRVGAKIPNFGSLPAELGVARMATQLETAGFDSLWISDHVVMPDVVESAYPFAPDGRAHWATDAPWYDAVALLGMMTAVTETAELGVAVMLLPLRHPVIFAKQAATIDALSDGRLALGVGVGWMAEEFDALGVPFETRGRRMEEWMQLCRECWSGAPAPFDGEHYQLPSGVQCYPVPGHEIPFLVGGHSRAALRRAGAVGNGWLAQQAGPELDPAAIGEGARVMRAAAESAQRDPAALRIVLRIVESAGMSEALAERLPSLAAVGVTDVIVDVDWGADRGPEDTAAAFGLSARG